MFPAVKTRRIPLPEGDRGIKVTIDWMRKAAQDGARDPQIRQLALQITRNVASRDSAGEIAAVYQWVKSHIKFRGEWDETVQSPEVTLQFGAGDCDDHAVLLCALLGSLGYRCHFKTIAVRGEREFTHVYAEVLDPAGGRWMALDTTVSQASPGWEPPDKTREKEWKALGRLGRLGRLGTDYAGQAASDITAAMPVFNAIADVNQADYLRNQYGPPLLPASAIGVNYAPGSFTLSSTTPSWFWLLAGGGLLLFLLRGRGGRRPR